jgi:hypothetical protein
LVYGPIGFAAYLRDTAPSFAQLFVSRGRIEVEQRQRAHGVPAGPPSAAPSGDEHDGPESEARVLRLAPDTPGTGRPITGLPIDGYDELSAAQVVDMLERLGRDELESIRDYESSHRGRSTILGKIEQLTRSA